MCIKEYYKENENNQHNWRKMFANHTFDRVLVSRIYKEILQLNNKKINNLILKMSKGLKQTFLQRSYTNGQQTQEQEFNITGH